ncbi:response regulator [Paenibacillus sp. HW567]|uniref:response regulator n=1 Tax=Paenibacillus sp. HW567 TaxID=1034769 RepID=UPI00036716F4|nr:response regulator transcription factor [Paenibacillus sp. HW567]
MNERIIWFAVGHPPDAYETAEQGKRSREERLTLEHALQELGLQTTMSEDLGDLRSLLSSLDPVLLLTELHHAAEWEGWGLITDLREQGRILPVMVISGGEYGEEAVAAFDAGGNDYMVKPVHIGEFKCRVENLLKLTGRRHDHSALLRIDGLILDPSRRLASRNGTELKMTPKEFDLLYYLAQNLGVICPRDEILKQVWGYHFQADTNVVDVYIRHIRLKMDKGYKNKLIHTVRGIGYVLRAPEYGATS